MLKSGPLIFQEEQILPTKTIFMDVTHVKRRDLPVKFSLTYDIESGRLAKGTTSIQEIRRNTNIGDSFHFENIRTQFSSEDGMKLSVMIESEEVVARIRAENNRSVLFLEGAAKEKAIAQIVNTF